ncbi:hypothetical protein CEXT_231261 [Caerostris extrusa]|uniref:Uncharacterized protein n=1 Tax=Caerostris extrusa TaxID=172846 RepID=A0AAV4REC3_CAEEX|nr:hypothetical protein CEXT_231261 [Caerostris extrusa]
MQIEKVYGTRPFQIPVQSYAERSDFAGDAPCLSGHKMQIEKVYGMRPIQIPVHSYAERSETKEKNGDKEMNTRNC